jgi:hypothetical protein
MNFIYFSNKEIYGISEACYTISVLFSPACYIISVLFSTKCLSLHNVIIVCSNNTFFISDALQFKYDGKMSLMPAGDYRARRLSLAPPSLDKKTVRTTVVRRQQFMHTGNAPHWAMAVVLTL